MSTFELELLANAERPQAPKLNVFDYVTRLVLPGLTLLAVIFKKDIQPPMFWSLLAFMVVSFAAGFYQPIAASVQDLGERRKNPRVAPAAFSKLRGFAPRVYKFIGGFLRSLSFINPRD